ncbi:MAG: hotdog domain-containing protein [Candidatus Xenobium sp.]|jgi:acyl-coenzyme A thioesterase PaaI-like protein|nr:thioesterase [Burkholderiales bacterium]
MKVETHGALNPELCGRPLELAPGRAVVEMRASVAMTADERGMVHGGFLFGLADHAAMLAVNHPNVVLASADVRFIKPVLVGDALRAEAFLKGEEGPRRTVEVVIHRGQEAVFSGTFSCRVPEKHVLEP